MRTPSCSLPAPSYSQAAAEAPEAFRADGHLGLQFDPFADASRVSKLIDASEQTVDVQGRLEATWREAEYARASARILLSRFVSAVALQAAGRA